MFKKLCFVLLIILLTLSNAPAVTIKGAVSYTVSEARQIAFDNVPSKIDIFQYKDHFIDKNRDENIIAMSKGKKTYKNRYLTIFADKTYAVTYKSNLKIGYYYNNDGTLRIVELTISENYPSIDTKYDIYGNLDGTSMTLFKNESFIFDLNKKLIAHWIDRNCYNENGELIDTRQ